jgi:predicted amidohydrolase
MKIALAQTKPIKGNISANMEAHAKLIVSALQYDINAIFFPELSLTGYEPELAEELAVEPADKTFDNFQDLSDTNKITIGVGMPIKTSLGITISMMIFQPSLRRKIYSKQQLHADEMPYFVNGEQQAILTINNVKVAPAICYESLQISHASQANELGAELYLASVAKSQNGIDKAMIHYPQIAKQFAMPVLMANCVGYCDNFESVGKSAVWTKNGELAGQLDGSDEGIIIFDTETEITSTSCY